MSFSCNLNNVYGQSRRLNRERFTRDLCHFIGRKLFGNFRVCSALTFDLELTGHLIIRITAV